MTPTGQEYQQIYPDRFKDGKIYCACGSSNIRAFCAPANTGDIFYACASCKTTLFTGTIYEKYPITGVGW